MSGAMILTAMFVVCGAGDPPSQPDLAIRQAFAAPGITAEAKDQCATGSAATTGADDQTAPADSVAPAQDVAEKAPDQGENKETVAEDAEGEVFVVTARGHVKADPLEGINLQTFAVAQALDGNIIQPTAKAYGKTVPEPVRMGVRNFFRNLHEPVVALNFLLQFKIGKAFKTLGRFGINTTVGGAGLFDMAKKKAFNLPYRPNGFANTLAYYGVKPGAFLYLPLVGPTTVRDLFGLAVDTAAMPTSGLAPITGRVYTASSTFAKTIDARSEGNDKLQAQIESKRGAYSSIRAAYLAQREAEVAAMHVHDAPRVARRDPAPVVPAPVSAAEPVEGLVSLAP